MSELMLIAETDAEGTVEAVWAYDRLKNQPPRVMTREQVGTTLSGASIHGATIEKMRAWVSNARATRVS